MSARTPPVTSGWAPRRRPAPLRRLAVLLVLAVVLAVLVRTFVLQAFDIPSDSMSDTLRRDDRILVSKLSTRFGEVERGQVVVFRDPGGWLPAGGSDDGVSLPGVVGDVLRFVGLLPSDSGRDLVKRVIGVPGDHVRCCDRRDRVVVNGVPLDEPYLYPGDEPSATEFDVVVPRERLWVMGDHRSNSSDSRAHREDRFGGMVPMDNVIGRAVAVLWPPGHAGTLPVPETFARVGPA